MADKAFRRILFIAAFSVYAYAAVRGQGTNSVRIATLVYPPFIEDHGGIAKGPLVDIVHEAFTRIGYAPSIVILPIARGLEFVEEGIVDAFFSLKMTEARKASMLFVSTPIISQDFVLFARRDAVPRFSGDLIDIAGQRIGIARKTSYGAVFDRAVADGILRNLDESTSFEMNFRKLVAGRIDLVINSLDVGMRLLSTIEGGQNIVILNPPVERVQSYLAFTRKRDFSMLATELDKALATMLEDGTVGRIMNAYGQ